MDMEKMYAVSQFAELLGKSVKTLQRWDKAGILKAYRTPTNQRYYTHAQYLEYQQQAAKARDAALHKEG
jgi:DNA-binding transcriptional MerR regulator